MLVELLVDEVGVDDALGVLLREEELETAVVPEAARVADTLIEGLAAEDCDGVASTLKELEGVGVNEAARVVVVETETLSVAEIDPVLLDVRLALADADARAVPEIVREALLLGVTEGVPVRALLEEADTVVLDAILPLQLVEILAAIVDDAVGEGDGDWQMMETP